MDSKKQTSKLFSDRIDEVKHVTLNEVNIFNLKVLGVQIGENCNISKKCSIYNHKNIKIGNNVRIDDFVVLSAGDGGIEIGDNVHISIYTSFQGKGKIMVGNYATISSRVSIYSSSDDYSGETMTNPMNEPFTNVEHDDVIIRNNSIIGAGCVILPGVIIGQSSAVGALSLVKDDLQAFGIYAGVPAKYIKKRSSKHRDFIKKKKNE